MATFDYLLLLRRHKAVFVVKIIFVQIVAVCCEHSTLNLLNIGFFLIPLIYQNSFALNSHEITVVLKLI